MAAGTKCSHCKGKAIITNSNDLAADIKDAFYKVLYVQCIEPDGCGARAAINMIFSHYVNPPKTDVVSMARKILEQQEQLNIKGV
ncbi:MAG: ogr/Delta-like zinc finger family protein [Alphaproteobacteria bacterium]|nr:ogr/Delta-like zinc finger family protein [Alphaproteobacteria bacterium]